MSIYYRQRNSLIMWWKNVLTSCDAQHNYFSSSFFQLFRMISNVKTRTDKSCATDKSTAKTFSVSARHKTGRFWHLVHKKLWRKYYKILQKSLINNPRRLCRSKHVSFIAVVVVCSCSTYVDCGDYIENRKTLYILPTTL